MEDIITKVLKVIIITPHDGNAAAGPAECKVVVRLHTDDMAGVVCALEAAGFGVLESTDVAPAALAT